MFEIPKDRLAHLSDADGRELVARLCEAELVQAGMPVSAVRWSGAQDAPDGGLDVDCFVESSDFRGDFVPRARTGFQVKKTSMRKDRIPTEMSPRGKLRPIFGELARCGGCYILVSLGDDPTETARKPRLAEMQRQVEPLRECGDLQVKFYGRGELAQWLRQHPGVALWACGKLGMPLEGWRSFRRWTVVPPGQSDELICRDGISIELPGPDAGKYGIEDGIDGIRELVRTGDKAVRIVGLSGVGKTRIVQALFEIGVGGSPLERHLAIYADLGEQSVSTAARLVEWLRAEQRPAILVLDNCPTEVHNSLAARVAESGFLKLITVEYDIRDDRPEITSVVQIQAEGNEIAETLVRRRYPHLGQVNAELIANFSGGNARLALALADHVEEDEGLSAFSNRQLFERLFWQRGALDRNLLEGAQVLSLVYSFSVSENEEGVDHLSVLAALIERSRLSLFRATQDLVERQLAQKRGAWRAILPHALANDLAADALNAIPQKTVLRAFQPSRNRHLLASFARRLGYLHDHEVARNIVRSWLAPGGMLHEIENLDAKHLQLLENAAPAVPDAVLDAIEARLSQIDPSHLPQALVFQGGIVTGLLCAIAYDPELFERSVRVLARFALSGETDRGNSNAWTRLCGLFSLYLSGTEAPLGVRLPIVQGFLFSSNSIERKLGFGMLEAALDSGNRIGVGNFHFGTRPRSYGWPRSVGERDDWLHSFLALLSKAAVSNDPALSSGARDLLANQLRSLWGYPGLRRDLAATARCLNNRAPWTTGWRAIRMIRQYDYKDRAPKRGPNDIELLEELGEELHPAALADRIRVYVLGTGFDQLSLDDAFDPSDSKRYEASGRRLDSIAFSLGAEAADNPAIVDDLSGELFSTVAGRQFEFGKGLASKSSDLEGLWNRLVEHLGKAGDKACDCRLLAGMIETIQRKDRALADKLLDCAIDNRHLRQFMVFLQCEVALDRPAVDRLLRAMDFEDTPLEQFGCLAWSRFADGLEECGLCDLMSKVLERPGGTNVVIGSLGSRFFSLIGEENAVVSARLRSVGIRASTQWFLDRTTFRRGGSMEVHNLERVLDICVDRNEHSGEVGELMEALFAYLTGPNVSLADSNKFLGILARRQPLQFLDRAFRQGNAYDVARLHMFREGLLGKNSLSYIDATDLLAWCRQGSYQERLAKLAKHIFPFSGEMEVGGAELSDQAWAILGEAEDASIILSSYAGSIGPSSWSGSRADIIGRRLPAFERLLEDSRPHVRETAQRLIPDIRSSEVAERELEHKRTEARAEAHRFE